MDLKDQVCSLKLAKQLKELGVKQESLWYWDSCGNLKKDDHWFLITTESYDFNDYPGPTFNIISAFTCAELGEMLPVILTKTTLNNYELRIQKLDDNKRWECFYKDWNVPEVGHGHLKGQTFRDKTEANTRAKMLIYLIKNNLIK